MTDEKKPAERSSDDDRDKRNDGKQGGGRKFHRYKKKFCRFCANPDIQIEYTNVETISRFVTSRGKILPRRVTGTCAKHQRALSIAIKRSRELNIMPFKVK